MDENYYLCESLWLDVEKKTLVDKSKTPEKELDINNFEDRVLILQREVEAWIIHPIEHLVRDDIKWDEQGEFIGFDKYRPFKNAIFVLFGIFAYIEKIERYKEGHTFNKKSPRPTEILTNGFKKIFPLNCSKAQLSSILEKTRHSMMHSANVGDKTLLNYSDNLDKNPVEYSQGHLKLNPLGMALKIKKDFKDYIGQLKSDEELQSNFTINFESIYRDEINLLQK